VDNATQDYVLGYLSRPYGTQFGEVVLTHPLKPDLFSIIYGATKEAAEKSVRSRSNGPPSG
jgi:hypothetical protein